MNSIEQLAMERQKELQAFFEEWRAACKGKDLGTLELLSAMKYSRAPAWNKATKHFMDAIEGVYTIEAMAPTLMGRILTAAERQSKKGLQPYVVRKHYGAPRWMVRPVAKAASAGPLWMIVKKGGEVIWEGEIDPSGLTDIQTIISPAPEAHMGQAMESMEAET